MNGQGKAMHCTSVSGKPLVLCNQLQFSIGFSCDSNPPKPESPQTAKRFSNTSPLQRRLRVLVSLQKFKIGNPSAS